MLGGSKGKVLCYVPYVALTELGDWQVKLSGDKYKVTHEREINPT